MNTVSRLKNTVARRERKSHIWEREEHEHYVEPAWVSKRLFDVESFVGGIWDPACGFGTILQSAKDAGYSAVGTDIVDRGGGSILNFFAAINPHGDNIVTNPPFDIIVSFTLQALRLANKVAVIFPVARLNAARWLQSTPLARIWLLTPRPSMPPGHTITSGEKPGGGRVDYCWLVFELGHTGGVQMDWLHRDGNPFEKRSEVDTTRHKK